MNVYLDTIGCRLNQSEIETYARQFRAAGHTIVSDPAQADIVVVNTCAVTSAAASDSRQKIRQAARAGAGKIIATGCWASLYPGTALKLPQVEQVVQNTEKDTLVSTLLQFPPDIFKLEPVERELIPGSRARTRAFIKVQDGCDNRCTFCITTLARGAGRSRTVEQIMADMSAVQSGEATRAREIVLTGVHLGSWGSRFMSPAAHW
jgi:threonylcarbamoyladenosine tRNA methylthiotransferase MtaB